MKQGLQLRFSQNLSASRRNCNKPLNCCQMSTLELNQEIDALMQTNPLLERGEVGEDEYGNPAEDVAEPSLLNGANPAENLSEAERYADDFSESTSASEGEFLANDLNYAANDIPVPDINPIEKFLKLAENTDFEVIAQYG